MADALVNPELAQHIKATPLVDSHEHLGSEDAWVNDGPQDVLQDLLSTYVPSDFYSAVVDTDALDRARNRPDIDVKERWDGIKGAWRQIRHTGYGEAMARQAKEIYGIDRITGKALAKAKMTLMKLRRPGERYRILKKIANLDHVQIDGGWPPAPDQSGPGFFFHDISWAHISGGLPNITGLLEHLGGDITDLKSYRRIMETIFDRYANYATGVKSQHAYGRTLLWQKRDDAEVERLLTKHLRERTLTVEEQLCLGDWGWARGVELATEYDLPFKMHTGFYAGNDNLEPSRIRAGHLSNLAKAYPDARLVCMHMAYPYGNELVAMAKQYRNIYADMCWGWSMNPYTGMEFVRTYLHGAPVNKLFAFGGDTHWATGTAAYASQAREWLGRALALEIRDGFMALKQAKRVATKVMNRNQMECFQVQRARDTAKAELGKK